MPMELLDETSDDAALIGLAAGMGLDAVRFTIGLNSAEIHGEWVGRRRGPQPCRLEPRQGFSRIYKKIY